MVLSRAFLKKNSQDFVWVQYSRPVYLGIVGHEISSGLVWASAPQQRGLGRNLVTLIQCVRGALPLFYPNYMCGVVR